MPGSEPFDPYSKWLGIPPQDQPPNHYRLLGLELFERDPDVIDAAARRVAGVVRSSGTGAHAPAAQKLVGEIAFARRCLLDPPSKRLYDSALPPVAARAPAFVPQPLAEAVAIAAEPEEFAFLEALASPPSAAMIAATAVSSPAAPPPPLAGAPAAAHAEHKPAEHKPLSSKERSRRINRLALIGAGALGLLTVGILTILVIKSNRDAAVEAAAQAEAKVAEERTAANAAAAAAAAAKKPEVKPLLPPASTPAEKAQLVDAVFQSIDEGDDLETFKKKLEATHRTDLRNEQQRSPLRMAVIRNREELVKELIARKFDVNAADVHGETALMSAAQSGNLPLTKMLLEAGARVNVSSGQSEKETDPLLTPLLLAAHAGNSEIVGLLLARGAKVDLPNADGVTPLMVAAWKGYADVVQQLLAAGAKVNTADALGQSALMFAAEGGKPEIVEALDKGADANAIGKYGNTALEIAEGKGRSQIIARIRAAMRNK